MDDIKCNKNFILNELNNQNKKMSLNSTSTLSNTKKLALALLSATTILGGSNAFAENKVDNTKAGYELNVADGAGVFNVKNDQEINVTQPLNQEVTLKAGANILAYALEINLNGNTETNALIVDANNVSDLKFAKVIAGANDTKGLIIDVDTKGAKNLELAAAEENETNFAGIREIKLKDGSELTITTNSAILRNVKFTGNQGKIKAQQSLTASLAENAQFKKIEIDDNKTVAFAGKNLTVTDDGVKFNGENSKLVFSTEGAAGELTFNVNKFVNNNNKEGILQFLATGEDLKIASDLKDDGDRSLKSIIFKAEAGNNITIANGKIVKTEGMKFSGNGELHFGEGNDAAGNVKIGANGFTIGDGNGKVTFYGDVDGGGEIKFTGQNSAELAFNPSKGPKSVENNITTSNDGKGKITVDATNQAFTFKGSIGYVDKDSRNNDKRLDSITISGDKDVIFNNTAQAQIALDKGITVNGKGKIEFTPANGKALDIYSDIKFGNNQENQVTFNTSNEDITLTGNIGSDTKKALKINIAGAAANNITTIKGDIYAQELKFNDANGALVIASVGNQKANDKNIVNPKISLSKITNNNNNQGKIKLITTDNREIQFNVAQALDKGLQEFTTEGRGKVKFISGSKDFVLKSTKINIGANTELQIKSTAGELTFSKDVTLSLNPTKEQLDNSFNSVTPYIVGTKLQTNNAGGTYNLNLENAGHSFKLEFDKAIGDYNNKLKQVSVALSSSSGEVEFSNLYTNNLNITKKDNSEVNVNLTNETFIGQIAKDTNISFQQSEDLMLKAGTNITGANYKIKGDKTLTLEGDVKIGKLSNSKDKEAALKIGDNSQISQDIGSEDQRFKTITLGSAKLSGNIYLAENAELKADSHSKLTGSVIDLNKGKSSFNSAGGNTTLQFGDENFKDTQKILAGANTTNIIFQGSDSVFDHTSSDVAFTTSKITVQGTNNIILLGSQDQGKDTLVLKTNTDNSNMVKLGADFTVKTFGEEGRTFKHVDLNGYRISFGDTNVYTKLIGQTGTIDLRGKNFNVAGIGESAEKKFGGQLQLGENKSYTITKGFYVNEHLKGKLVTLTFEDDASVSAMGTPTDPMSKINFIKDANLSGDIYAKEINYSSGTVTIEKRLTAVSKASYNNSVIDLKNNTYSVQAISDNDKNKFEGDITLKTVINSSQDYGNMKVENPDIANVRSVTYKIEVNPEYRPNDGTEFQFAEFLTSNRDDIIIESNTFSRRLVPGSFSSDGSKGSLIIQTGLNQDIVDSRSAKVSANVRGIYTQVLSEMTNVNTANGVDRKFEQTIDAFKSDQERAEYIVQNIEPPVDAIGSAAQISESVGHQINAVLASRMSTVTASNSNIVAAGDHDGLESRYGAWIKGIYSSGQNESSPGMSAFDTSGAGIVIGADAGFGDSNSVGIAYGYLSGEAKFKGILSGAKNDVESHIFSLYGTYYLNDSVYTTAALSMSNSDIKMKSKRSINDNLIENVENKTNSKRFAMQLLGHYKYAATDNMDLIPFAGLGFARTAQNGFSDKIDGSAGYIKMKDNTFNNTNLIVGASIQTCMEVAETPMMLSARLAYNYFFDDKFGKADMSLAEIPLNIDIKRGGNSVFDFGVDLTANVTDMLNVGGSYDVRMSDKYANHTGALKVKVNL